MDAQMIGAIFAGVTGLLTVVMGYLLNRSNASRDEARESEVDALRRRFTAAMAHIYELRAVLRTSGATVPAFPPDLDQHTHQETP